MLGSISPIALVPALVTCDQSPEPLEEQREPSGGPEPLACPATGSVSGGRVEELQGLEMEEGDPVCRGGGWACMCLSVRQVEKYGNLLHP